MAGDGLRDRLHGRGAVGADGHLGLPDGVLQGAQLQYLRKGQAGDRNGTAAAAVEGQHCTVSPREFTWVDDER